MHKSTLLCALLVVLLPLPGCAAVVVGAAGAAALGASKDQTIGQSVDDTAASNAIKARLMSDNATKFGEVDVEVSGGLVLLTGRVYAPEDRAFAEGVAWDTPYTGDVANEIRIEQPGGFLANVSDEVISGRVRARLLGSKTVKAVNYNVETYNGIVYLMGIARTEEELHKATREASLVPGVKQVVSYIRLRPDAARQGPASP